MSEILHHCNMDDIVEELSGFEDIAIMIIGAHECSYFIHKFPGKNIFSYLLTDKELSLGDYSELISSIKSLEKQGQKLVIISTCISEMINLQGDIVFNLDPRTTVLNGSNYKKYTNVIEHIYCSIIENENIEIKEKSVELKSEYHKFTELCDDLFSRNVICTDDKYKKVLESLSTKYGVVVKYATN